jgi:hypothetical protein
MKTRHSTKKLALRKITITALDRDMQKLMKGGDMAPRTFEITVCNTLCECDKHLV